MEIEYNQDMVDSFIKIVPYAEYKELTAQIEIRNRLIEELRDALRGLLDGLDSNYDERLGLTNEQWNERIAYARKVLVEHGDR